MYAVLRDLLAGATCPGCARPGRLPCVACETALRGNARSALPEDPVAGLSHAWSAGAYDGLLRVLILGHKERLQFGLRRLLGVLLAEAVEGLCGERGLGVPGPLALVPVPSQAATVRARGHDPTLHLTREAARGLQGRGWEARVVPALRVCGVADQAGLSREERAANLAGAMWVPRRRGAGLIADRIPAVVCDDVLTTGATAGEAQRALTSAGVQTLGAATVALTVRRHR